MRVIDLFNECRTMILFDTDASDYRWKDAIMVKMANLTILEILKKKPILKFSSYNQYATEEDFLIDDVNSEMKLPEHYHEAFLHGLAMHCLNSESNNALSIQQMQYEKARFDELMAF